MVTRADFYIGRSDDAEWLGSVALGGYPSGIANEILNATSEQEYRHAVEKFLDETAGYATKPDQGWPWPWDNSDITDYAYAWDNGVWHTIGYNPCRWWKYANGEPPDGRSENYDDIVKELEKTNFPDMSHIKNVSFGRRSGLIMIMG